MASGYRAGVRAQDVDTRIHGRLPRSIAGGSIQSRMPFAYFQRRAGGVGFRIFAGTMLGLVFFLLGRLFTYLGVINDWPPLFSAAFPVAAFVVFAAGMLWWLERR